MLATPPNATGPAARLERLVRSFRQLETNNADLDVGMRGTITPGGQMLDAERGVDIRLRCPHTGSVAMLRLSRGGAALRAVSAVRPFAAAVSVIEDQLGIHFDSAYRWGPSTFASADELANALLSHLQRRLAAVTEVCGGPVVDVAASAYAGTAERGLPTQASWRRPQTALAQSMLPPRPLSAR
jgi:hypothetical protein